MTRIESYANWVLRQRYLVMAFSVAFVALLAAGGQNITFTNDYRYFFSDKNPHLRAFLDLQETYAAPDTIIWVMQPQGEKGDGTQRLATDADTLKVIKQFTEDAWQTPHSTRVDSIANFQHTTATEDELIVTDLVPDVDDIDEAVAHKVHEIATNDPVLVRRAISVDGRTAAVIARLALPTDDLNPNVEAVQFARDLQEKYRAAHPDIRFELTGSSLLSNAFSEGATNDLKTLTPLMYVVIALTVWLLLRSVSATGSAMIVIALATVAAMGATGWIGIPISPPSANAPTVILTVAVADSIHVLVTMLVEMRKGRTKNDAIVESLRVNFVPVLLTSVTTAIGFMSLNFSDAHPIQDLGTISAIGAMVAWFLSIGFLPALLSVLPITAKGSVERQSDFMAKFAGFVIRRKNPLLMGSIIIVVFFAAFTPTLKFNDMFAKYFDERMDFRTATDFTAENLTTIYQIHWSVQTGEEDGINDPLYMQTIENFTNFLRAQPLVMQVNSVTDVMKRVNKSMNADDEAFYRVPDTREEVAQNLLLFEMSLPYGL
ncbi:MAG: efflux RND transporter permease subunit, partial [Alphaproteobacteria bacterium]